MIGYHTPETKHELLRLEYSQFDSFQWQIIPIVCFTGRWLAAVFTDYGVALILIFSMSML
jgi:hypothetical protein